MHYKLVTLNSLFLQKLCYQKWIINQPITFRI